MIYIYPVVFSPEDEGGYCVYAPDFPGCVTSSETIAEGMAKIRDGIGGMLYIANRDKKELPPPSPLRSVECEPGDTVSLVDVDLGAYQRRVGAKAVRRTISIPEWLDDLASSGNVSLSQITQDALRQRFDV